MQEIVNSSFHMGNHKVFTSISNICFDLELFIEVHYRLCIYFKNKNHIYAGLQAKDRDGSNGFKIYSAKQQQQQKKTLWCGIADTHTITKLHPKGINNLKFSAQHCHKTH